MSRDHPEIVQKLAEYLDAARIPAAQSFDLTEEQLEALRALGYTQ